jgi:hypothetical protein
MASRGAATEWPAGTLPPFLPTSAGDGCGGAIARAPAAQPLTTISAFEDAAATRVSPTPQLHRIKLADGVGVCLHRIGAAFTVEVHAHDEAGGLLLSMTQAQAAALAVRLMTFAQLVPGFPPGEGL